MSAWPTRFTLLRSLRPPDYLTLANGVCGLLAVFAAMGFVTTDATVWLVVGVALVATAILFDTFDGRLARALRVTSTLGREMDSLADLVSFGVAPAALGYAAGLRDSWGVVALILYLVCAICRLARYNATFDQLAADTGKVRHFEGTPVTFGLVPLALTVGLRVAGQLQGTWQLVATGAFMLVAATMVSKTLRIPKF